MHLLHSSQFITHLYYYTIYLYVIHYFFLHPSHIITFFLCHTYSYHIYLYTSFVSHCMYHMHHKIPYNFSSINLSFLNILVCNHMFLYYTYILPLHIPYVLHIFFHICLIIEFFYFLFAQMHKPNAIWPSTPYIFFHTVISTSYCNIQIYFILSFLMFVLYIHSIYVCITFS